MSEPRTIADFMAEINRELAARPGVTVADLLDERLARFALSPEAWDYVLGQFAKGGAFGERIPEDWSEDHAD